MITLLFFISNLRNAGKAGIPDSSKTTFGDINESTTAGFCKFAI
jgi:hypothetical protein